MRANRGKRRKKSGVADGRDRSGRGEAGDRLVRGIMQSGNGAVERGDAWASGCNFNLSVPEDEPSVIAL